MAQIRQSRPDSGLDSGLDLEVKVFETFEVVASSLGGGSPVPDESGPLRAVHFSHHKWPEISQLGLTFGCSEVRFRVLTF